MIVLRAVALLLAGLAVPWDRLVGQAATLQASARVIPAEAVRDGLRLVDSLRLDLQRLTVPRRSSPWAELRLEPIPPAGGRPGDRLRVTIHFLRN